MKYIRLNTTDPYYNLAVEEYLFRHTDGDFFMLWQNDRSVIIGKNQNAYAEVNVGYAAENGISIARRITGGGAVYHDLGNVNYSFITSSDKAEALDHAYFTRPLLSALFSLGIEATLSGRNDIEYEGRKISGNAGTSDGLRILHHGTLLFDTDTDVMAAVLRVDKEKLKPRAIASHKSRVTNLSRLTGGLSAEEFIDRIESHMLKKTGAARAEAPDDPIIRALVERNASPEWIFSDKRFLTDYTLRKKKRFPFGTVSVEAEMNRSVIESIVISGDFFGISPVSELESLLKGKSVEHIRRLDVSSYVGGMTADELYKLITD